MLQEIDLTGIYVAPFALYMVMAGIIFVPLRFYFDRIEIQRWFWHRALFDAAAFVIILSLVGLVF
jgi:protein AaeX